MNVVIEFLSGLLMIMFLLVAILLLVVFGIAVISVLIDELKEETK